MQCPTPCDFLILAKVWTRQTPGRYRPKFLWLRCPTLCEPWGSTPPNRRYIITIQSLHTCLRQHSCHLHNIKYVIFLGCDCQHVLKINGFISSLSWNFKRLIRRSNISKGFEVFPTMQKFQRYHRVSVCNTQSTLPLLRI